jgi:hypothetical protein
MKTHTALLSVCLAVLSSAVIVSAAQRKAAAAPLRMDFVPTGNLQLGTPGDLLPEPIGVRTKPGALVRFFSPDFGVIEESGAAEATVRADERGVAGVHVRLGENLGQYTVIASPAEGDGTDVLYTFRAIGAEAFQAREAKLAQARASVGGGR